MRRSSVVRRQIVQAAVFFAVAWPLSAGYPTRESWIPIAGRATGFGGRGFFTTVHLTDLSGTANDVTISFFATAQPNVAPRTVSLRLDPGQSAAVDVGPQLAGDTGSTGALRIRSSGLVVA